MICTGSHALVTTIYVQCMYTVHICICVCKYAHMNAYMYDPMFKEIATKKPSGFANVCER